MRKAIRRAAAPERRELQNSTSRSLREVFTPEDAADFLGVSSWTLAQWRSQSRGPLYSKLEGRLVRYRRTDLEEYLSAHSVDQEPSRRFRKS